jgi:N-acetylglucosamine kinase-like BadF-type ATPase
MRQFDGRGDKTILTQKAFEHFTVASADELITKIYQDHADVASFAPKVFEAVVERDRIAHLLIVKNATELSDLVRVLTMKVRPKKMLAVALMGGLLESENVFSKLVKEKIHHSLPHVVVQKPKFSAAFGAAILALNAFR